MKKFIFFVFLSVIGFFAYSQTTALPEIASLKITPPTPEAASLIRFVEYPVSYCTGIPEISVPLYTVQSREISFPLSLDYHASGIKVEDVSGFVGLGWSLNAGGVISRVGHGNPEHTAVDMRDQQSIIAANDFRYLKRVANDIINANLDRYYYNFCGISGSFVIQPDETIVQIPETENRIERISARYPRTGISSKDFKITTPDGKMYFFSNQEYIVSGSGSNQNYSGSSWYLSKILSFNQTDSVCFQYSTEENWTKTTLGTALAATVVYVPDVKADTSYTYLTLDNYSHYNQCQLLTEIQFNGHKITCSYASGRTDTGLKKRLKEIALYTNNVLTRRINIDNASYFPDGRMKLSKIEMFDKNHTKTDEYAFKYINESQALIGKGYAQDLFGFYNGKNNVTLNVVLDKGARSSGRNYAFPEASYYTLNEVRRITGGFTRLTYEPGTYGNTEPLLKIGIRIAKIEEYADEGSPAKTRTYTYENAVPTSLIDVNDTRNYLIQSGYNSFRNIDLIHPEPIRQTNTYYSSSVIPGIPIEDIRIYYGKVTETITGNGSTDVLRNVYEYNPQNMSNQTSSCLVHQSVGTSEHGAKRYIGAQAPSARFRLTPFDKYAIESNWAYDNLLKKTVYKQENGTFVPVEETTNTYGYYHQRDIQTSLFSRNIIYMEEEEPNLYADLPHTHFSDFFFFNVYTTTGCCRLKTTTVKRYSGSETAVETTAYDYNSLDHPSRSGDNMQVRSQTYTAGGKEYIRRFYYPADYTTLPYTSMRTRNNILPLIKEELETDNMTVRVENHYSNLRIANTYLTELTSSVKTLNGTETDRVSINYDEYGHPVCLAKTGEPTVCYLWGYGGTYPVAEIRNTDYTSVVTAMGGNTAVKALTEALVLSTGPISKLNALRTALPQAEVTTYTYQPLVGVTSITDPTGRKINYEYDAAGRLQKITDEDGNPVNTYEYVIKGQ